MRALFASGPQPEDPLSAIEVGDRPEPEAREGWVKVKVAMAALNRHDLWTLRGVGIKPAQFPMILGCDGAGTLPDGSPVLLYPVIGDPAYRGDETVDPTRTLLTELHQGTAADFVVVPERNAVPLPDFLSAQQAATLGTSYLTAYRMIFTRSGLRPGATMLVQGATGGVSTALIQLGRAAGMRVWATSRSDSGRDRALRLGADRAFEPGARLPERVDGVFESIGQATWAHSMRAVRPGGVLVCCGATSGPNPPADLQRLFFLQISVIGSTLGTMAEFHSLLSFLEVSGVQPVVDEVVPLEHGREALTRMENESPGKIVLAV